MEILEQVHPHRFDHEHRLLFEPKAPSWQHVMLSGSLIPASSLKGTNDDTYENYDVRLVVGPWWKHLQVVVPFVTINGFLQTDWDEVDEAGWTVRELTWDTVGGPPGPNQDEERVRLKFILGVKGVRSYVTNIAYHLTAAGRRLGDGGVGSPAP